MKSVKQADVYIRLVVVLFAAVAAIIVFAGCASAPKTAAEAVANVKPEQKTEVLDDKGAAFSIQTPQWLAEYLSGGNKAVEKLYKDKYCFVIEYNDAERDFAVAWVSGAEGPRAVSQKVSSSVVSQMENNQQGEKGSAMEATVAGTAKVLSDSSFSGISKEADWWQIVRNKETQSVEARAFALWVIDRKELDRQITANIQHIVDNNTTMSAAERAIYAALIADITGVGLDNT
ncbi:hypothetical protein AGMMS49546_34610 [Spirochaetia bacterium]|nr:hypothetical protein AGMMS49546_34610 [Spirochaetia bacterium]